VLFIGCGWGFVVYSLVLSFCGCRFDLFSVVVMDFMIFLLGVFGFCWVVVLVCFDDVVVIVVVCMGVSLRVVVGLFIVVFVVFVVFGVWVVFVCVVFELCLVVFGGG